MSRSAALAALPFEVPLVWVSFRTVPPVLAVEVAGQDEDETSLTSKAHWYLDHGVLLVWLVFPATRTVHVLSSEGTVHLGPRDAVPRHPALPGLAPKVRDFFAQLK